MVSVMQKRLVEVYAPECQTFLTDLGRITRLEQAQVSHQTALVDDYQIKFLVGQTTPNVRRKVHNTHLSGTVPPQTASQTRYFPTNQIVNFPSHKWNSRVVKSMYTP
jgi:hypothetical protein